MEMMQATSCSNVVVNPFSASSNSAAFGQGFTAFLIRRTARPMSKGFFSMGITSMREFTTNYQIIFSGHHVPEWRRMGPLYPRAFPLMKSVNCLRGGSLVRGWKNEHICHVIRMLIGCHCAAFAGDGFDILVAVYIHSGANLIRQGNCLTDESLSIWVGWILEDRNQMGA